MSTSRTPSPPSTPRRLVVDWTRCDGHGLCAALAPELVRADPWGFPIVAADAARDPAATRRLVALCPALALREEGASA